MLVRRLALAIGLFCALVGSQLPEFAQQYRQRLGGAIDELNRLIGEFDSEAGAQSMTQAQGIDRLKNNADDLARQRGAAMESDVSRVIRLGHQRDAFQSAGPLRRLVALIENFDPPTAAQAIADYEPAVPITSRPSSSPAPPWFSAGPPRIYARGLYDVGAKELHDATCVDALRALVQVSHKVGGGRLPSRWFFLTTADAIEGPGGSRDHARPFPFRRLASKDQAIDESH